LAGGDQCNASCKRGTLQQQCNQSMALTPEQIYKLGAEALGWNNTTAAGKASIAEDMALLKRLNDYQTLGQTVFIAAASPDV
jgi:hypothetical protein